MYIQDIKILSIAAILALAVDLYYIHYQMGNFKPVVIQA